MTIAVTDVAPGRAGDRSDAAVAEGALDDSSTR